MPLQAAQIPDSSSATLAAQVTDAGGEVVVLGIARDDRQDIVERLRRGVAEADIVVASGGVSVGAHDEVRLAFEDIGQVDLWRVAIQPGKPLAFGRCQAPDGRTGTAVRPARQPGEQLCHVRAVRAPGDPSHGRSH